MELVDGDPKDRTFPGLVVLLLESNSLWCSRCILMWAVKTFLLSLLGICIIKARNFCLQGRLSPREADVTKMCKVWAIVEHVKAWEISTTIFSIVLNSLRHPTSFQVSELVSFMWLCQQPVKTHSRGTYLYYVSEQLQIMATDDCPWCNNSRRRCSYIVQHGTQLETLTQVAFWFVILPSAMKVASKVNLWWPHLLLVLSAAQGGRNICSWTASFRCWSTLSVMWLNMWSTPEHINKRDLSSSHTFRKASVSATALLNQLILHIHHLGQSTSRLSIALANPNEALGCPMTHLALSVVYHSIRLGLGFPPNCFSIFMPFYPVTMWKESWECL